MRGGRAARSPFGRSSAPAFRIAVRRYAGVVAFLRSGDPATGEFSDAEILSQTGVVDLSAFSA
jgi:hypothetical protein